MSPLTSISNVKTLLNNFLSPAHPKFHLWTSHYRCTWKWEFSIWKRVIAKVASLRNPPKPPKIKKEWSEKRIESIERTPEPPRLTTANNKSSNEYIPDSYSQNENNLLIQILIFSYIFHYCKVLCLRGYEFLMGLKGWTNT